MKVWRGYPCHYLQYGGVDEAKSGAEIANEKSTSNLLEVDSLRYASLAIWHILRHLPCRIDVVPLVIVYVCRAGEELGV